MKQLKLKRWQLASIIGIVLTIFSFAYLIDKVYEAPPYILEPSITVYSYSDCPANMSANDVSGALYSTYRGFPLISYEYVHAGTCARDTVIKPLALLLDFALYSLVAFAVLTLVSQLQNSKKSI